MSNHIPEDFPQDPKHWTWDHVNHFVKQIGALQEETEKDRVEMEAEIQKIKDRYAEGKKEREAKIKAMTRLIKKAYEANEDKLSGAKSIELDHGVVGKRLIVSVKYQDGVDEAEAVRRAEEAKFFDLVKIEKRLLKEALKAKGSVVLELIGCRLANTNRFFVEARPTLKNQSRRRSA